MTTDTFTITREGDGHHKAGRVYVLHINGVYAGTYDTRRSALDAAQAAHPSTDRTHQ